MARKLNHQKYCGWCGAHITYKTEWASTCNNCAYTNYINPRPSCNIIITKGEDVLMVRRSIQPQRGKYDFPGGFMDTTDSSMEEAAARELNEELGLSNTAISDLHYLGSDTEGYEWQDTTIPIAAFFYTCELIDTKSSIRLDEDENSEVRWFGRSDVESIDFAWDIDKRMLGRIWQ